MAKLEEESGKEDFWKQSNAIRAKTMKDISALKTVVDQWEGMEADFRDIDSAFDLLEMEEDPEMFQELLQLFASTKKKLRKLELNLLLGGPQDNCDAIMEINSGAGGTESMDWTGMLYRMYVRWAEEHQVKVTVLDYQSGDEAGIKSATIALSGEYAYGKLKTEMGVHRLVRISPFDANKRRHTSFASVFVYPDIEDEIEVVINESDLKIDTFRASGAGGQHVNTTDSAVRITHMPSGIVTQSQAQRSQHQNRDMAMKVLKAALFEREQKELQKEKDSMQEQKKEIGWGSQIRSYILHPYQLVKDHRTNVEIGNAASVLDGNVDPFIEEGLSQEVWKITS